VVTIIAQNLMEYQVSRHETKGTLDSTTITYFVLTTVLMCFVYTAISYNMFYI